MLELFVIASWLSLVVYATWLFARAKRYATLRPGDAYVLWRLHKHESQCNASSYVGKFHEKEGVVGFKCLCGYEYESKRPMV